eukprot:3575262-Amphidinium_carterae.2
MQGAQSVFCLPAPWADDNTIVRMRLCTHDDTFHSLFLIHNVNRVSRQLAIEQVRDLGDRGFCEKRSRPVATNSM